MMKLSLPALLEDSPVDTDQALLPGLGSLADRLAHLLPALPHSSPVLVSGDWGSGKTSLLRAVQRRLAGVTPSPPGVVWFEAWRYEGESSLLVALLRKVWEATPKGHRGQVEAGRRFQDLLKVALTVSLRAAPAALGLVGLGPLGELFKGLGADAVKKDVQAVDSLGPTIPERHGTDRLWDAFHELLASAWPGGTPVIIFVDDLDRCSPEGAVSLLEAIRVLVTGSFREDSKQCRFVVALDREILGEAVARKYAGLSAFDSTRFLKKVFPVSFDLPLLAGEEIRRLIERLLQELSGDASEPSAAASTQEIDALKEAFNASPQFANPRLMRRCLQRFALVKAFERQDGASRVVAPAEPRSADGFAVDRAFARWVVAIELWPQLRLLAADPPSRQREALAETLEARDTPSKDPWLGGLLQRPGLRAWLEQAEFVKQATYSRFAAAEARLRRWGL